VVTVEVGADVVASGAGEGKKTKMVALMGCCCHRGKGRSHQWRGRSVVERIVVKSAVIVVVVEGTIEKEKEERERRHKKEKNIIDLKRLI